MENIIAMRLNPINHKILFLAAGVWIPAQCTSNNKEII